MTESTLSISYSDLMEEVGNFLGYKPDSANWSDSERAEVDRYIQAGVRQFYYPPAVQGVEAGYSWSFLSPEATIVTVADTGTQDLPDDLARVLGDFYFDDQQHRNSVIQVSEGRIQACTQRSTDTGAPMYCTVRHKEQVAGTGQRMEVVWYPTPDAVYTLHYEYEAYSGKLSDSNPYPLGGMRHSELVLESCLAAAEQRGNDEIGNHTSIFRSMLSSSVAFDRRQGAKSYGRMGQPQENSMEFRRSNGMVSYKGNTW
jgi:hypothetical protein